MAGEQPKSTMGWMTRYVLFPAIIAMLLVLAAGGYLAYRDYRIRAFTGDVRPFLEQLGLKLPRADHSVQKVSVGVPPKAEQNPAPKPVVTVDSYAPDAVYPLEEWQVVDDPAGFIDWVKVDGVIQPVDEPVRVYPGQIIELGGWAGHRLLGMRFAEVLLSVCDVVIAGTPVDRERPDIAASVHPNLNISGWQAKLYAGDIPACTDPEIRAWGRPPVGTTLRPVVGGRRLEFVEPPADETGGHFTVAHVTPAVLPDQAPRPVSIRLENVAGVVKIRRCGDMKCTVLSTTREANFEAVIVERHNGWLLLQSKVGSGWIRAGDVVPAP